MKIFATVKEAIKHLLPFDNKGSSFIHFDHALTPQELKELSTSLNKNLVGVPYRWNTNSSHVFSYFFS